MEKSPSSEEDAIVDAIIGHENPEWYRLLEGPEPHALTIRGRESKYTPTDMMRATVDKDHIDVVRKFTGLQIINSGGVDILSDIQRCNNLWTEAIKYLQKSLLIKLPPKFQETVRGTQDIRYIWSQAAARNQRSGIRGLYCAGLKVARAIHELRPEVLQAYAEQTDYLEGIFFQDRQDVAVSKMRDGSLFGVLGESMYYDDEANICGIPIRILSRLKDEDSCLLKLLKKPEADIAVIDDAVGFRLFVRKRDDIEPVLRFIVHGGVLQNAQKLHPKEIEIKNKKLLEREQWKEATEWIKPQYHNHREEISVTIKDERDLQGDDTDADTNEGYKAINIRTKLSFTIPGQRRRITMPVEFQIYLSGLSSADDASEYKLRQRLAVLTRLFGHVSEKMLMKHLKATSEATGRSIADLRRELFETRVLVPITDKLYMHRNQFDRLANDVFMPPVVANLSIDELRSRVPALLRAWEKSADYK